MRINLLLSAIAALFLTACAGIALSGQVYVGTVIADQSERVQREVVGRANYIMPLYRGIQSGQMTGPNDEVRLFIQNGRTLVWEQRVRLQNGIAKVSLPVGITFPLSSGLCVETPWPLAYQRVRPHWAQPGQHVMCTEDGALHRHIFTEQRGRTPGDAYGVAAVRAR